MYSVNNHFRRAIQKAVNMATPGEGEPEMSATPEEFPLLFLFADLSN